MSQDLLLDIGTTKATLAVLRGDRAESPVIFERHGQEGEPWVRSILSGQTGDSLAVSASGLVSGGRVYSAALGDLDLLEIAAEEVGAPALVINDGHAAALAAGRSGYVGPLLACHVGTSLAVGIWSRDGLWEGDRGWSGETLRPVGGSSLEETYKELSGKEQDAAKIVAAASRGEEEAQRAVTDTCEEIAEELHRMIYFADPASLVLSGGALLDALQPNLLPALWRRLRGKKRWEEMMGERIIEVSPLGGYAPLFGAAALLSARPDFSLIL